MLTGLSLGEAHTDQKAVFRWVDPGDPGQTIVALNISDPQVKGRSLNLMTQTPSRRIVLIICYLSHVIVYAFTSLVLNLYKTLKWGWATKGSCFYTGHMTIQIIWQLSHIYMFLNNSPCLLSHPKSYLLKTNFQMKKEKRRIPHRFSELRCSQIH